DRTTGAFFPARTTFSTSATRIFRGASYWPLFRVNESMPASRLFRWTHPPVRRPLAGCGKTAEPHQPRINADKRRLKNNEFAFVLSAFIRVHRRPNCLFSNLPGEFSSKVGPPADFS